MPTSLTNTHNAPPIIAILRGLKPNESEAIAEALILAGVKLIEVPMNSPQAIESVRRMQAAFADEATFGVGTLTASDELNALAATGAKLAISPHCNPALIQQAIDLNLKPMPGVMTPSEAFAAIGAGATDLKFFPASLITTAGFKAFKAVLPPEIGCWAVGGINRSAFKEWMDIGIDGFGIGSALYKPGWSPAAVERSAKALVEQLEELS